MKFEFKKEKMLPLSRQDMIDLGWVYVDILGVSEGFQKDNFWAMIREDNGVRYLRIVAKDPSLIHWMHDPERFMIIIKDPTRSHLEIIQSTLT